MIFELTDSVITEILFAMENQQETFFFDADLSKIVPAGALSGNSENLLSLPQWTSADGYNLLESFVSGLHSAAACEELRAVLAEGRGVFRNFKNTLRKYPEIERRFHSYKHKQMCLRVIEWYNALRESWGLEKLSQDFDEYDSLVHEDFQFRPYSHESDMDCVKDGIRAVSDEFKEQFPGDLGQALSKIWTGRCECGFSPHKSAGVNGFVCRTLSDDFAGCLLFNDLLSESDTCSAVSLTVLFVNQNYRGLGIARELLSQSISSLRERGVHFFIIADSIVPEKMKPMLSRMGFESLDFVFVIDLFKNQTYF